MVGPRALNLLPTESGHYGKDSFTRALTMLGYGVVSKMKTDPTPGDLVVMWNRYGTNEAWAKRFEAARATVLVIENGYLGKQWRGSQWYTISRTHHNTHRPESSTDPSRWASWQTELAPWRQPGGDIVILGQRGIGEVGIKSPTTWPLTVVPGARVRKHPGKNLPNVISLEDDLAHASEVLTWASSSAIKAIMLGIPAYYGYKRWVAGEAGRPFEQRGLGPNTSDAARLRMFERLAWCMWSRAEVESGQALAHVLGH